MERGPYGIAFRFNL